ncbi:Endoplasmic reticulum-Golgi intermediate compartment protein [Schistosoma japonicum]|uniref:Endoplasmic reticulum-Golgi intermediate compartment protein 3 n=1 Tax=Schistosoma japonicum TaxID=6182 RepID=A0A4Z2DBM2_SCHJA|nr:Endoplasmic reticulum-Golgi intermediate compartment protein [Schistosoma japonicum]
MVVTINYLRNFDAFAKPLKDFRVKTMSGAMVSIISSFIIGILFTSEFISFMRTQNKQEIIVDINRGEKMSIYLDITINFIPCAFLRLDTMDTTGAQQLNVMHEVYKTSVSISGNPLSNSVRHTVNDDSALTTTRDPNYCGSCYGADSPTRKCCNTCEEVQMAYHEMQWVFGNASEFEQCRNENWDGMKRNIGNEGCRIHGSLTVNRVGGGFHIAPGHSYTENHAHVHSIRSLGHVQFNVSHSITELRFGDAYPGQINSLDGTKMTVDKPSQMFNYYLKLVPTMYTSVSNNESTLITNQYSATWHSRGSPLSGDGQGLPGVFFNYEIAPLLVKITEERKSFVHFLTNTCAIIGGVFTVASLLDAFIYQSSCVLRNRRHKN